MPDSNLRFSHTNIHTQHFLCCRCVQGSNWAHPDMMKTSQPACQIRTYIIHTQHLANKNHTLHVHNTVCMCRAVTGPRRPALICQILTYISHMLTPTVASVKNHMYSVSVCRVVIGSRSPALSWTPWPRGQSPWTGARRQPR